MTPPVLLIAFNRPQLTKKVIDQLRLIKPHKVYVNLDGPRQHVPEDTKSCLDTKKVIQQGIDWECDIKYKINDHNLGCRHSVSMGITWFFEEEEMGIIIEDDCLVDPTFFKFAGELLEKYKDNHRVMHISADNFQDKPVSNDSYYFSKFALAWGWATWRRAWVKYDVDMKSWTNPEHIKKVSRMFANPIDKRYWRKVLDNTYNNLVDTWDYQWLYTLWINDGIAITPAKNLSSNVGDGKLATHTINKNDFKLNRESYSMIFPLIHPRTITVNKLADSVTQRRVFRTSLISMFVDILNKVRYKI